MEAIEEVMGSKEYLQIIKRKRTKRQRSASPIGLSMASTSCITAEGSGSGGGGGGGVSDNSGELEEDMANCLILLAQGQTHKLSEPNMYECKTCNRSFLSFQALGGHRASHKKPKPTLEGKTTLVLTEKEDDNSTTTTLSLQISNGGLCSTNNKARVHECSICGAEFRSGQALGGHMRRHRTIPMGTSTSTSLNVETQEGKKARNLLSLDLNLPAPEDDHRQQLIVFSSSSLVDCHY